MSDSIRYWGKVTGFRKDEKEEIENKCLDFQDAMLENVNDEEIVFQAENGWRGGGQSCEEIIKEHFQEFTIKKPHIKIEVYCTYVEYAPVETITLENDKISAVMN